MTISSGGLDTAWTVKLLQSMAVGLEVLALAYPAIHYFDEPRWRWRCGFEIAGRWCSVSCWDRWGGCS